jgi:hypothetical protein
VPALLNQTLFALAILLQIALIILLLRRRLASHLRIFTALLIFYCLRSAVLVALAHLITLPHHPSFTAYAALATVLSLADLLLQCALAVALARTVLASEPGPHPARLLLLALALFLLAALLTAGLVMVLPARSPAPADRGVLFPALLFLELFAWSTWRPSTWRPADRLTHAILVGLAAFGAASVLSQAGKCLSAAHRDRPTFAASTYLSTSAYLAVLVFWILRCRAGQPLSPNMKHPSERKSAHLPPAIC